MNNIVFVPGEFLSTLSLRRATLRVVDGSKSSIISIHALLAESDFNSFSLNINGPLFLSTLSLRRATLILSVLISMAHYFYPRSPCGERLQQVGSLLAGDKFLSTLSLRRATEDANDSSNANLHFYPRSPCGERRRSRTKQRGHRYFYPRSPCGERHVAQNLVLQGDKISIHALLAESDVSFVRCKYSASANFYPRSPCGERQQLFYFFLGVSLFLSTLSLRRATSPHRPAPASVRFLSTLSLRRATLSTVRARHAMIISIHALLAESDYLL